MAQTHAIAGEVQELTWAIFDDQATDEQIRRLEQLLLDDPEARHIYVTCMQMHADLYCMLGGWQPRLPPAVKRAMATCKKEQGAALPVVDVEPISAHFPDVFA